MKKYVQPSLNEEVVSIEDVIAVSLGGAGDFNGEIPSIGAGDFGYNG